MKKLMFLLVVCKLGCATNVLVPDTSLPGARISACSGSPTRCTISGFMTPSVPAFALNDQVVVANVLADTGGGVYKYSNINSPLGVPRKICSLIGTTVGFCDLANTPLQAEGTTSTGLAFIRRVTVGTMNAGPLGLMGSQCSSKLVGLGVSILYGSLTNIVVSGGIATVSYANGCAHNLITGNQVQVRNGSDSGLNGVKTITKTGAGTFTYPTSASSGTYTDTNLSVSSYAVDGDVVWEHFKTYISGVSFSPYVSTPVDWASGPALGGAQCIAAAIYAYIDPSQSNADSYATSCFTNLDDIFPIPYVCSFNTAYLCNNTQGAYDDYSRLAVPYVLMAFGLHAPRLSGPQQTYVGEFFSNMGANVGTSCTSRSSTTFDPGTITITGANIVGSGTSFLSHSVGDYVQFTYSSGAITYARLATITDNTHATRTATTPVANSDPGSNYIITPPTDPTVDCGYSWKVTTHPSNWAIDPNIILSPWWVSYPFEAFPQSAGNNQGLTASAYQSSYSALCAYSTTACEIFQRSMLLNYEADVPNFLAWGMFNNAGQYYSMGRTGPLMSEELYMNDQATSFTGFHTALTSGLGLRQTIMQEIYNTTSASSPSADYQISGWNYDSYWTLDSNALGQGTVWANGFIALMLGLDPSAPELGYANYYLSTTFASRLAQALTSGGLSSAVTNMTLYNPNWPSTNITSLPLNYISSTNSLSLCSTLGVACPANSSYTGGLSRTNGWSFNATASTSIINFTTGLVASDHGAWAPDSLPIIKGTTYENVGSTPSVLVLFQDNPSDVNGFPCTCTVLGTNLGYNVDPQGVGSNLLWTQTTNDDYYDARWDIKPLYGTGNPLTVAQSVTQHLKLSGAGEFYSHYVYTTGPADSSPWYRATIIPSVSASFSGSTLVSSNSDLSKVSITTLKPAGSTSIALINDATSYTNQSIGYRTRSCSSTNGTTCTTTPSSLETLEVGIITPSSSSPSAPVLLAPDSNWTGAIAADPLTATNGIMLISRHGTTQPAPADFTSPGGQHILDGISNGSYTVLFNGSPVSGSPFSVTTNTLEFLTPSGSSGTVHMQSTTPTSTVAGKTTVSKTAIIH